MKLPTLAAVKMLSYAPTPTVEWKDERLPLRILVKLEYHNHPFVSGNKWWKLKYNLEEAQQQRATTLLTFGGPYSNHIFATAATARELSLASIGIIRGEDVSNPTLEFAKSCGMKLHFVSREEYKSKNDPAYATQLARLFGDFFLIPEGGTNERAIKGCSECGSMLLSENVFDTLCLPVGTGGTMAGLARGMSADKTVIGFAALKGAAFLNDEVSRWLSPDSGRGAVGEEHLSDPDQPRRKLPPDTCAWKIETGYHFGGYAKRSALLDDFIGRARLTYKINLDPVYTAKMMFGVLDLAMQGKFAKGSTVMVLHTGGLQAGIYESRQTAGSGRTPPSQTNSQTLP